MNYVNSQQPKVAVTTSLNIMKKTTIPATARTVAPTTAVYKSYKTRVTLRLIDEGNVPVHIAISCWWRWGVVATVSSQLIYEGQRGSWAQHWCENTQHGLHYMASVWQLGSALVREHTAWTTYTTWRQCSSCAQHWRENTQHGLHHMAPVWQLGPALVREHTAWTTPHGAGVAAGPSTGARTHSMDYATWRQCGSWAQHWCENTQHGLRHMAPVWQLGPALMREHTARTTPHGTMGTCATHAFMMDNVHFGLQWI